MRKDWKDMTTEEKMDDLNYRFVEIEDKVDALVDILKDSAENLKNSLGRVI